MNATVGLALGFLPFLAALPAQGQDSLYRIRSRDMGIEGFDLTVTETRRTSRTSILNVPGFHGRSAAASRWLMCVYTHLAFRRGFKYWAAVYPEPSGEDLLVGFPDSEIEDVSQTLGPEFVGDRMLPPQSVESFQSNLCGNLDGWPTGSKDDGRAGAPVPPLVGEELAPDSAMKSDLRSLIYAEELFFADSARYTSRIGPGGLNFHLREGNKLLSLQLTDDGWAARIGHAKTQTVCAIYVGSTPLSPATKEGAPACK